MHSTPWIMRIIIALLLLITGITYDAKGDSRIKDIVSFEGVRDNVLIGYGLVVGLNGTGDNLKNAVFTEKGLTDFLERLGVNTRGASLKTKNIAAVVVTATLPGFARAGSKLSVDVSTIGDAKSIKGGMLLATPLLGADGEVYAVAQGPVSVGMKPSEDPSKPDTASPTAGFINNGGIIERELGFALDSMKEINLALRNPDITTAKSIENAINLSIKDRIAFAKDPGTVSLQVPKEYSGKVVNLLSEIENINIYPDMSAKIVIDEATGTIVMGDSVSISKVAVAQGNILVKIGEEQTLLTSLGLAPAEPPSKLDQGKKAIVINETAKLSDLVKGINALGVRPKDMIAILKTIKDAGALHAEIITK